MQVGQECINIQKQGERAGGFLFQVFLHVPNMSAPFCTCNGDSFSAGLSKFRDETLRIHAAYMQCMMQWYAMICNVLKCSQRTVPSQLGTLEEWRRVRWIRCKAWLPRARVLTAALQHRFGEIRQNTIRPNQNKQIWYNELFAFKSSNNASREALCPSITRRPSATGQAIGVNFCFPSNQRSQYLHLQRCKHLSLSTVIHSDRPPALNLQQTLPHGSTVFIGWRSSKFNTKRFPNGFQTVCQLINVWISMTNRIPSQLPMPLPPRSCFHCHLTRLMWRSHRTPKFYVEVWADLPFLQNNKNCSQKSLTTWCWQITAHLATLVLQTFCFLFVLAAWLHWGRCWATPSRGSGIATSEHHSPECWNFMGQPHRDLLKGPRTTLTFCSFLKISEILKSPNNWPSAFLRDGNLRPLQDQNPGTQLALSLALSVSSIRPRIWCLTKLTLQPNRQMFNC